MQKLLFRKRKRNTKRKKMKVGQMRERERERVPTLIEYMEEDEDVVLVDNVIDDYDEERDLVPMKWRHIGFDEYIL
jgi:hypothetical protein